MMHFCSHGNWLLPSVTTYFGRVATLMRLGTFCKSHQTASLHSQTTGRARRCEKPFIHKMIYSIPTDHTYHHVAAPSLHHPPRFTTSLHRAWLRGEKNTGAVPLSLSAQLLTFQIVFVFNKKWKERQETLSFHDNNNFCCRTCICGRWRLRSLKINKQSHLLDAGFLPKLTKRDCTFEI